MFATKVINSKHTDLIHDVQYDHYGRRLVTCSSDQFIKVWELLDGQEWNCVARLKGHIGSVWRASWADPEFGQVIASCGFDRTIAIWQETPSNQKIPGNSNWVRRAQLVEARTSVTDIQFAPSHLGLLLASCSTDGMIRLYEAEDVMDLSNWTLQYDFPTQINASCLTWSQSQVNPTMLAVGNCNPIGPDSPKVILFELTEGHRCWNRVEMLTSCISGAVHAAAFAPNIAKSYHCLAVAADRLYIFYIVYNKDGVMVSEDGDSSDRYSIELAFVDSAKVWRVGWNATGTTLTSSGEDGSVRLWQRNHLQYWQQVSSIQPDSSSLPPLLSMAAKDDMVASSTTADSSCFRTMSSDSGPQFHRSDPITNRNN